MLEPSNWREACDKADAGLSKADAEEHLAVADSIHHLFGTADDNNYLAYALPALEEANGIGQLVHVVFATDQGRLPRDLKRQRGRERERESCLVVGVSRR